MAGLVKWTIFKTKWGYFGLAADNDGLLRSILPCPDWKTARNRLLAGLQNAQYDEKLLKSLQEWIIAYFEGRLPSSVLCLPSSIPLALDHLGPFQQKVLACCRKIPYGKAISYSQLARMVGNPRACRAVGSALAGNPVPLVVPCHRVIRSDGSLGNFSASATTGLRLAVLGGKSLKNELLHLEHAV
jgi:O-6-methylguanine DNA methyltransferase